MTMRARMSPVSIAALLLTVVIWTTGETANASVCGDSNWDTGEFCGQDAVAVTGATEMNHDCRVDGLDAPLLVADFASFCSGPGCSGDFNFDQVVNLLDVALFTLSYGSSVSPCTPSGMRPDACQGTIALSFANDPNAIVSTQTQAASSSDSLWVVASGTPAIAFLEYAIETSPNINITLHTAPLVPTFPPFSGAFPCDPDAQHSYRLGVASGPWPMGAYLVARIDYDLVDANPAWISLTPNAACYNNSRISWGEATGDRTIDFATVLNAGINGPAQPGVSTCRPPQIPSMGPLGLGLLAGLVGAIALARLARAFAMRRAATAGSARSMGS